MTDSLFDEFGRPESMKTYLMVRPRSYLAAPKYRAIFGDMPPLYEA
jgi:hypothetical protein